MAFGGPRLDTPSAVGEDGRPRAASLTVAGVVVATLFLATVVVVVGRDRGLLGALSLAGQFGVPPALATAGVALLTRERLLTQAIGIVMFLLGGTLLVGAVGLLGRVPAGLVVVGCLFAVAGMAATWTGAGERGVAIVALKRGTLTYVAAIASLAVLAVVWLSLTAGLDTLGAVADNRGVGSVLGLGAALLGTGLVGLVAVRGLPIVRLAGRGRRRRAWRWRQRLARAALGLAVAGLAVGALGLGLSDGLGRLPEGPVGAFLAAITSAPVVWPVAAVGLATLFVTLFVAAVDLVADRSGPQARARLAVLVAGVVLGVVAGGSVLVGGGFLLRLLVAGAALLFGVAVYVIILDIGLLSARTAGPALAATGLMLAALAATRGPVPAPLVFALAAGGLVVWDLSSFGLGVTAELGHRPSTRRLELYHAVVTLTVAGGAVVTLSGVWWLRETLGTAGAVPAAALTVVGVAALSVALAR